MSQRQGKLLVTVEQQTVETICNDCGIMTVRNIEGRIEPGKHDGWVSVQPLEYGCEGKYYLHFCPACSEKRGLLVGNKHPDWK